MARTKVWIAGPRSWENPRPIYKVFEALDRRYGKDGYMVLEGGTPGVDVIAWKVARERNVFVAEIPAPWDTRLKSAGPQRNNCIAEDLQPHLLIALHFLPIMDHFGTRDAVLKAHLNHIPVKLVKVKQRIAMPSSSGAGTPGTPKEKRRKKR